MVYGKYSHQGKTLQWDTYKLTHSSCHVRIHTNSVHKYHITHYLFHSLWKFVSLTCILPMPAGGEQPIPLWNEHDTSTDADKPKILLYSLSLMFKVSCSLSFCMKMQKSASVALGEATK